MRRLQAQRIVWFLNELFDRTLMLTGDGRETAIAIAEQIGLVEGSVSVRSGSLSGDDLDRMNDNDLGLVVNAVSVYYRVSPRHKVRIVRALQVLL